MPKKNLELSSPSKISVKFDLELSSPSKITVKVECTNPVLHTGLKI